MCSQCAELLHFTHALGFTPALPSSRNVKIPYTSASTIQEKLLSTVILPQEQTPEFHSPWPCLLYNLEDKNSFTLSHYI